MAGSTEAGKKAAKVNTEKNPHFYKDIGSIGGKAPHKGPRGFAAMTPERRREISRKSWDRRKGRA